MKLSPRISRLCKLVSRFAHVTCRNRFVATIAITSLLSGSVVSLSGCKGQKFDIGPSTGEVVGVAVGAIAIVGVTTGVLIHENHAHHTLKGCVSSGPNGPVAETDDKKTWLLTGDTPRIRVGNVVKLHGNKIKRPKHAAGDPTFDVQAVRKDYGPCKVAVAVTARLSDSEPPARAE